MAEFGLVALALAWPYFPVAACCAGADAIVGSYILVAVAAWAALLDAFLSSPAAFASSGLPAAAHTATFLELSSAFLLT